MTELQAEYTARRGGDDAEIEARASRIDIIDRLSWASERLAFINDIFSAVKCDELDISEDGMCGFCQILREIGGLIDEAGALYKKT